MTNDEALTSVHFFELLFDAIFGFGREAGFAWRGVRASDSLVFVPFKGGFGDFLQQPNEMGVACSRVGQGLQSALIGSLQNLVDLREGEAENFWSFWSF